MATSLTLEQMTSTNTKKSRSITNINPDATNQQLINLATSLNALTTNTLKGINRVDKTEIDTDIVYSTVEAYWSDDGSQVPTGVTIDGLTININNASITETVVISIGFRIQGVTNANIVFNSMTVKNTTANGVYAAYSMSEYTDITNPRTQLDIQYLQNSSTGSETTTLTIPGGSTTVGSTTYYYATFTLTVNQIGQ